ncbi:MAG: AraC family transcriptional regulator ligand-binding domain-containing protein [Bulleidia sp.]
MGRSRFLIDGRYEDLLRYFGLEPASVLKKAQLPEDSFRHQTVTMKEEEYYRFLEAVSALSEDPGLPVKMATVNQIESFSPPIFACWCSRNGEISLQRLERYKKLIGPMRFALIKRKILKRLN